MGIRIFYLLPADHRMSSGFTVSTTSITVYWANVSNPARMLLAFEQGDTLPPMPKTEQQYYDRTFDALEKGDTLTDAISAMKELQWWAICRGLAMCTPTVQAQAPEPAQAIAVKPGQTQIVQEWLLTQDAQALVDRAWAATMAIAKGA